MLCSLDKKAPGILGISGQRQKRTLQYVMGEFVRSEAHLRLLDLKLPYFNGFHWCEEIRRVSQVPVIFLSSAADDMNMVMAMTRGADDFVAKPFNLGGPFCKVQAILRRTYSFGNSGNLLEHRGRCPESGKRKSELSGTGR